MDFKIGHIVRLTDNENIHYMVVDRKNHSYEVMTYGEFGIERFWVNETNIVFVSATETEEYLLARLRSRR